MSAVLALVVIAGVFAAVLTGDAEHDEDPGPPDDDPGREFDPGDLPPGAAPWVRKAGQICPEVSPAFIAAVGQTESGWRTDLTSPAGAVGPFQILLPVWAAYGRDANNDGTADPRSIPDAAVSAGYILCDHVDTLENAGLKASVANVAASYNAGPGRVLEHRGVPPITETQEYVRKVKKAMEEYSGGPEDPVKNPGAKAVIAAAQSYLGTPYSWSGGDYSGPTEGSPRKGKGKKWDGTGIIGFDCSGLMEYAFYKGTNGKVRLPSNTRLQIKEGKSVPLDAIQPGDMVFFDDPETGRPFHVALYIGNDEFVHAPSPGKTVTIERILQSPFWAGANPQVRRVLSPEETN